jgi:hypothetical protein
VQQRVNLSELINTIKEREGLTWRQLQDRARQRGAPVPTGMFHMANRPLQDFPRTKTIYGISAALGVPPEEVAAAALESLHLARRDVVEIKAEEIHVRTSENGAEMPEVDRWIVIVPDADTPDRVLESVASADAVRLSVVPDDLAPAVER